MCSTQETVRAVRARGIRMRPTSSASAVASIYFCSCGRLDVSNIMRGTWHEGDVRPPDTHSTLPTERAAYGMGAL